MEELVNHLDNAKTLFYVSLAAVVVTLITHLIFKRYKYVKYLPGVAFIGFGFFSLYQVGNQLTESQSISNILLFLICVVGGFTGLLFALIIGIYNKPRRKRKKDKKDNMDD